MNARRRNPGGEFFAASPGLEGTFSDAGKGSPAGMRPESGPLACPFNMDPCRRGNGTRPRMHEKRHGITRPATLYSYWDRRQFRQWSHQRVRSRDGRVSRQGAQSPRASDRHRPPGDVARNILPADRFTLVLLKTDDLMYCEGHTYREFAAISGCPVDTLKARMFHARQQLQALPPDHGEEAA